MEGPRRLIGFPRHRAAASLKRRAVSVEPADRAGSRFSAASGRGLIEARRSLDARGTGDARGFPRHRAAASLKPAISLPRAHRRNRARGFPRHRAAASLKLVCRREQHQSVYARWFSAASGRGLIEARHLSWSRRHRCMNGGFPRHRAAASLKLVMFRSGPTRYLTVEGFRGIGPRPH